MTRRVFTRCLFVFAVAAFVGTGCVSSARQVAAKTNPLRVGVYVGAGAQSNGVCYWQMLTTLSPDIEPRFLDEKLIAEGMLDGLDVLVMPGGDSYLEFATLTKTGADEKIKAFIREGGGFVGTCAGNCIALNEKRRLRIAPFEYVTGSRPHGTARLAMKFNDHARELCGIAPKTRQVRYSGGPVMRPGKPVEGAKFESIATYDCDLVSEYGTNRTIVAMRGHTAAICGTYGKGRVFAIATHPEYRADTLDILEGAFRYASGGRSVRLVRPHRKVGDVSVAVYAPGVMGVKDAQMVAKLVTTPGLDVVFVNQAEEIGVGALDHVDALVLPAGRAVLYKKKMSPATRAFFQAFADRGGKVYAVGTGKSHAPTGSVCCETHDDLVAMLERERSR